MKSIAYIYLTTLRDNIEYIRWFLHLHKFNTAA